MMRYTNHVAQFSVSMKLFGFILKYVDFRERRYF